MFGIALSIITLMLATGMVGLASPASDRGGPIVYGNQSYPLTSGGVVTVYGHHPGDPIVVMPPGGEIQYVLGDHLGSTRVGVGPPHEYAPYGRAAIPSDSTRYAGHPYDPHREVYETPLRHYDATSARFLSVDSARQGASPYPYAENDPISYLDSTGAIVVPFFMKTNMDVISNMEAMSGGVLKALDAPKYMRAISSTSFQSKGPGAARKSRGLTSTIGSDLIRSMKGRHQSTRIRESFTRNKEFYWLIGGDQKVEMPDELSPILSRMSKVEGHEGAATRIIILDFTGTGTGEDQQASLKDHESIVINLEMTKFDLTQDGRSAPIEFSVRDDPSKRSMNQDQFQSYVRSKIRERWDSGGVPSHAGIDDTNPPNPKVPKTATPTTGELESFTTKPSSKFDLSQPGDGIYNAFELQLMEGAANATAGIYD